MAPPFRRGVVSTESFYWPGVSYSNRRQVGRFNTGQDVGDHLADARFVEERNLRNLFFDHLVHHVVHSPLIKQCLPRIS